MEFLDLIESVRADEASPDRLYAGIGRRPRGRRGAPNYQAQFAEALNLVERVMAGNRMASVVFEEALSTDDFPLLFGDIIDRMLLGAYREWPAAFPAFVKESQVRDFRLVSRFAVDGAENQLAEVPQGDQYPESGVDESRDQYRVRKYGRRLPLLWELLVNDDLDSFRDFPLRLGRAARRTEQRFVTELYVDANGPHANLYTVGNGNIITGNPPLTVDGLQQGFEILSAMTDVDGEPIPVDAVVLVIGAGLEVTARSILNATEIRPRTEGGGSAEQELVTGNWLRGRLTIAVDPYIGQVASAANGATSWFLFADPNLSRPAVEFARLRGHLEPEIWIKQPNAMRVGGGLVGPDQGDFETDSIAYRVRHVFGGARLTNTGGYRSTVASNGSGV